MLAALPADSAPADMAESLLRVGTPGAGANGEAAFTGVDPANAQPQYVPYRPPGCEYTPPASPQPSNPYAGPGMVAGLELRTSKRPANLRMDTAQAPAYERPTYSPSPTSSPPLGPLASPHFPPRQRAPSLLRHIAVSSPLNDGFPRAEQPLASPTFSPMVRQASGPGPTSDPRTIFNPLASNPVDHDGPSWTSLEEPLPAIPQHRPRGLTSSSQQGFMTHPPLRAATSIPDYSQHRTAGRKNPSSAYRPDRGGANWSHNDSFPPPYLRNEESRASFRSGWTMASSSFVDVSGTERSSMATGRSSPSDARTSFYSLEASRDENASEDYAEDASYEDDFMSVEDVIDSYCYDDSDEQKDGPFEKRSRLSSSQLGASDSELPGLSQTNSQSDRGSARLTPEPYAHPDAAQPAGTPLTFLEVRDSDCDPLQEQTEVNLSPERKKAYSEQGEYVPHLRLSSADLELSPTSMPPRARSNHHRTSTHDRRSVVHGPQRNLFGEIYNDLRELPLLPEKKSRLSRQDWQEIQAYSRKNSRGSMQLLDQFNGLSPTASLRRPALVMHSPPAKDPCPLPKVHEDEKYPRRASTSVFDRRSTLLELTRAITSASPPPPSSEPKTQEPVTRRATGKRRSGQSIANSIISLTRITPVRSRADVPTPSSPVERDIYGFKKATDKISAQQYDAWYSKYEEHVSRRRAKWVALMEKQNLPTSDPVKFPEHCEKVRRYCRKGYPPEWRGAMWWFYSNGQKKLDQMPGLYASLVERVKQGQLNKDDREAIERDLDRTFPDNIHFRPDPTPGDPEGTDQQEPTIVRDLREVLQCFALNNPGIGYCQSLNFIAGLLLLFMKQDVEKVFILLTIITQYHLPGAHARSLANTEVNVLMMLIKDFLPKVWASINDTDLINSGPGSHVHPDSKFQRQPTVALSCTSWFMSLFVGVLPIEVVLRVWDAFLYEGPRALFRYALAIFKLGEPEIRKFHPGDGELFMTVQNLPRACLDPNTLHDIAFVKKGFGGLSQNLLDDRRLYWQQALARKAELPTPRAEKEGFRWVTESTPTDDDKKKGSRSVIRRRQSTSRRFFRRDRS